jgi:hypothetical protein
MVAEVSCVLHNKVPEAAAVNEAVPLQLLVTVITGAAGAVFGAAMALPGALVQPFTVWVTVYVPGVVTLTDNSVAPVFHSTVPVETTVSVEVLSQLFVTCITGASGATGDAFIVSVAAGETQAAVFFEVTL